MICLFCSPTKTINLFGCSWLINTRPLARSVIYDLICPKSNDLYSTYFTLLHNSQLAMNIHWPCYCTVDVFVVIHFVTVSSMWALLMEAICECFYCLFIYVLPLVIQLSREKGWDPLPGLIPPHFGHYPRPEPWFLTYIVILFFVLSDWK